MGGKNVYTKRNRMPNPGRVLEGHAPTLQLERTGQTYGIPEDDEKRKREGGDRAQAKCMKHPRYLTRKMRTRFGEQSSYIRRQLEKIKTEDRLIFKRGRYPDDGSEKWGVLSSRKKIKRKTKSRTL